MKTKDIRESDITAGVEMEDVKGLVAQGTMILILPDSKKLLVCRASRPPQPRVNRNPGQFDRLLGNEPVRAYVPLMLRPWVMDCTHKEGVHSGEKVTLEIGYIGGLECQKVLNGGVGDAVHVNFEKKPSTHK